MIATRLGISLCLDGAELELYDTHGGTHQVILLLLPLGVKTWPRQHTQFNPDKTTLVCWIPLPPGPKLLVVLNLSQYCCTGPGRWIDESVHGGSKRQSRAAPPCAPISGACMQTPDNSKKYLTSFWHLLGLGLLCP
jgi:hypothetical protein